MTGDLAIDLCALAALAWVGQAGFRLALQFAVRGV